MLKDIKRTLGHTVQFDRNSPHSNLKIPLKQGWAVCDDKFRNFSRFKIQNLLKNLCGGSILQKKSLYKKNNENLKLAPNYYLKSETFDMLYQKHIFLYDFFK